MKRNYLIATYWEGGSGPLRTYMIHGNDIFYGSDKEAQSTLNYVRRVRPEEQWQIFYVEEHTNV